MKKRGEQQKTHAGAYRSRCRILYTSLENVHGAQARATRRGPPGSTIIIYKELIRFNSDSNSSTATATTSTTATIILPTGHPVSSRQGAPLREGFLPHFVGGTHHLKNLLFTPYPAIPPYVVRTPHPGITDDREHIASYKS